MHTSQHSKVKYASVLFVTPTPGGELVKELTQREEELNRNSDERVKFVEKGGLKMKDILCIKNPFKGSKCEEKKCPMCNNSKYVEGNPEDNKFPCNSNNVGYRWRCLKCKERDITKIYEGETGRSARIRGSEHVNDLLKKRKNSVLFKHISSNHQNEDVKFKLEITGRFRDALSRQSNEAVRIHNRSNAELLNSKSEFNHPPLARVVVQRKTPIDISKK